MHMSLKLWTILTHVNMKLICMQNASIRFCFCFCFFLVIFPLQLQKAWGIVITLPGGVGGQHMDTHVCRSFKLIP